MREKQIIMIPTDKKYKAKNILWSEALNWCETDDAGLLKIIEDGIEVKGFYLDEALVYNNKVS